MFLSGFCTTYLFWFAFVKMKGLWVTQFPRGWLYFYSGFQFLGRLYTGVLMRSSRGKTFPSWYFSETSVLKYLWSSPHFRGFWTYHQKQKPCLESPGFKHQTWWWALQKGYWPNFWEPSWGHGFPDFFTWFGERGACQGSHRESVFLSRPAPFPPQPRSWVTLAVPVLLQEFWSFTNTTWVTARWKVPGTSRLVAVQLSQQPPARPWSSTSPACARRWGWSPTTRGKWHAVPDPSCRHSLRGLSCVSCC